MKKLFKKLLGLDFKMNLGRSCDGELVSTPNVGNGVCGHGFINCESTECVKEFLKSLTPPDTEKGE